MVEKGPRISPQAAPGLPTSLSKTGRAREDDRLGCGGRDPGRRDGGNEGSRWS